MILMQHMQKLLPTLSILSLNQSWKSALISGTWQLKNRLNQRKVIIRINHIILRHCKNLWEYHRSRRKTILPELRMWYQSLQSILILIEPTLNQLNHLSNKRVERSLIFTLWQFLLLESRRSGESGHDSLIRL